MKLTSLKNKFSSKSLLILVGILILAAFLRLVNINKNPPSLYGDELSLLYDSYSILHTAHDQSGQFLPLIFQQGGGRPGGYVYLNVPFVAIFGLTPMGVRFLSVLSGLGLIVLVFLFTKEYFDGKVALLAALFWSISPWDIGLSRGGFEAHLALFWGFLGVYTFLKAEKNLKLYIVCALSFFLAAFTYPTYQLVGPALVVLLIFVTGRLKFFLSHLKNIPVILFILIFVFNVALNIFLTLDLGRNDRFQSINIFSQQDIQKSVVTQVDMERSFDVLPPVTKIFLHNKILENIEVVGENYIKNFSLDFLFLHGDSNPVHNPATMGGFYLVDLLLIIIGSWSLLKKNLKLARIFLVWILIAPLATSIVSPPHALRSDFMLPPLLILSALGLYQLLSLKNVWEKKVLLAGVAILFLIQFAIFVDRVYFVAPKEYSSLWAYPSKVAADLANQERSKFDYVILSSRLPNLQYAYPVYAKLSPQQVILQNQCPITYKSYTFLKYDNVYIGEIPASNINNFLKSLTGSALYIGTSEDENYLTNYQSVSGLDHTTAIVIEKKDKNNVFYK